MVINKYIHHPSLTYAPLLLPLILVPLLGEWAWKTYHPVFFSRNKELFLVADIIYIVIVRLALLDAMLFLFSRSVHALHITLIRIVALYLEITVVTILYFALMFYIFDVFHLFQYNASIGPEQLANIKDHDFLAAFYISTVSFTTLGLGDWVPQSLNAMMAISTEVILGVVQAGVFMAIMIYAHQNKEILGPGAPTRLQGSTSTD
ncbi:ion channel [Thiolapillus brandeum]|uniref:Potassium channel domain-containing protein n=1 Tax=Thiolapillus brandeum TaxID=1076588 RepID=A0A7U6GJM1_9GAMM|nr:ion channel [Thiolapillus brandeum]BAO44913.1 conserved hypothetical protein [Thiolapillus brandeum]